MQATNNPTSAGGLSEESSSGFHHWLLRTKLYLIALVVTLGYLFIGRANSNDPAWVQVNLPLSSASVLILCLSAVESYLFVRRVRQHNAEMAAARAREIELQQRLAFQRQTILSQITGSLIDRLDTNQIPTPVLEKIGQLFEANVVAMWVVKKGAMQQFLLRGVQGLNAHDADQLQAAPWSLAEYDNAQAVPPQIIVIHDGRKLSASLASFVEREHVVVTVLTPIVRRQEQVGLIGLFYREPITISDPLAKIGRAHV